MFKTALNVFNSGEKHLYDFLLCGYWKESGW